MSENKFIIGISISFLFGYSFAAYLAIQVRSNESNRMYEHSVRLIRETNELFYKLCELNEEIFQLEGANASLQKQLDLEKSVAQTKKTLEKRICSDAISLILSYIGV
jgi:hypothetical protein